jgi:hypothetical protein
MIEEATKGQEGSRIQTDISQYFGDLAMIVQFKTVNYYIGPRIRIYGSYPIKLVNDKK